MRRTGVMALAVILLLTTAVGCSAGCFDRADDGKLSVVCTIFPQYDWIRQILGDNPGDIELTVLQSNRIDLHNFQPSFDDVLQITASDLFIYIGGESDKWVGDALSEAKKNGGDLLVINLLDVLGDAAKIEEIVEGMENPDDHDDDDDDHDDNEHDDDDEEYDEHVWLSLRNAEVFCSAIAGALSTLDPENAREYENNLADYKAKLSALDAQFQAVADEAAVTTLLFGDRFPFRYLMDDYGLNYHAAFPGCSAETEASFDTIVFLATKTDELNLNFIMVTESADQSIARAIINHTKGKSQQILVMDSMQSISSDDANSGATYLFVMESNLAVLKDALN